MDFRQSQIEGLYFKDSLYTLKMFHVMLGCDEPSHPGAWGE